MTLVSGDTNTGGTDTWMTQLLRDTDTYYGDTDTEVASVLELCRY